MTRRDLMRLGLAGAAVAALPTLRLTAAEREKDSTRTPITAYLHTRFGFDESTPIPGIYRFDPQTGSRSKVVDVNETDGCFVHNISARVSPDGSKLAYSGQMFRAEDQPGGGSTTRASEWLWVYDYRDGSRRKIVQGERPVWSGDSRRLYFRWFDPQAGPGGRTQPITRVVDLDGSNMTDVPIPRTEFVEDCSRDGDWLVTTSNRHGVSGNQTHIIHPDGTGDRQLTDYLWSRFPRISPDGRSVACTVFEGNDRHLDVVDVDGRNRRRVLQGDDQTVISQVAWSPAGEDFAVGLQRTDFTRIGRGVLRYRPGPAPDPALARVVILPKDGGPFRTLPIPPASVVAAIDWR